MKPGDTLYVANIGEVWLGDKTLKSLRVRALTEQHARTDSAPIHCTRIWATPGSDIGGIKIHLNGRDICHITDADVLSRICEKLDIAHVILITEDGHRIVRLEGEFNAAVTEEVTR